MTDHSTSPSGGSPEQEPQKPAYTPASFEKRAAAWVGLAYMVIIVLATTYMIATAETLTGTAPLLLIPGAAGAAVVSIHRWRLSPSRAGLVNTVFLVAVCALACVLGLVWGIPRLLAHFGVTP